MPGVSLFDPALGDSMARLKSAIEELEGGSDAVDVARRAARQALELTGAARAAIALSDAAGASERVVSATSRGGELRGDEAAALFAAAGRPGQPAMASELRAGGRLIGAMAAGRDSEFSDTDRQAFEIFAGAVASALDLAAMRQRQREFESAMRMTVERLSKVDAARQMLLKNMTVMVDRERKRFVSELHDDALQKLTAVEISLARLAPGAPLDGAALESLAGMLRQTESALRRLVFQVHPPSLDSPDGLERSIRERVAMVSSSSIDFQLEVDVPPELPFEMKSLIFRQVAEAIANVERHSGARRVEVLLRRADDGILGVVADDGSGFDVAERSNLPGHMGLQALKERALMAGGRYTIESRPGAGTRIEFWLPLGGA